MHPPVKLRGPFPLLVLLLLGTLALSAPAAAVAGEGEGSRAEQRAQRAEERAARRAAHRQEVEARRAESAERRAARRHTTQNSAEEPPAGETPAPHADRGCEVTISVSAPQVVSGETVTVSGAVHCPAPAAAAALHVTILERQGGEAPKPAVTAPVATAADGSFSIVSAPLEANTVFQVREGRHRARASVKVAPTVTLSVVPAATPASASPSGRPHRQRSTFTGAVAPAAAGELVALQVSYAASGERWRSVAWTHTAADGTFAIAKALRTPGVTNVRALVHAGRHISVAVSEPVSFEVPQPQNPQLTIASSADPLVAGQTVTISGVVAGAAGAAVKLLARSAGGAFAVVAEATTDGSGNYAFTESPLHNTVYRVAGASDSSTSLFESVAFALTPEAAPSTVKAGEAASFTGTVSPAAEGQAVYLEERRPGGGFHTIAVGAVTSAPAYSIGHTFTRAGSYTLRIKVPGAGANETTTGAPFALTVEA